MKRKYIILLIGLQVIIMLFIALFPNPQQTIITTQFLKTSSTTDLEYDFQDNIYLENTSVSPYNTFNLEDQFIYTQDYNATYDFLNETIGTYGDSIGYVNVDNSGAGTNISVLSELEGHNHVLNLSDPSGTNQVDFDTNLQDTTYGTYEFWIYITLNSYSSYVLYLKNGGTNVIAIQTRDDSGLKLRTDDGGGGWGSIADLDLNRWYHIRIDFDCTGGGYLGLSQYTYEIILDGEVIGTYDFMSNEGQITKTRTTTGTSSIVETYIDAIGVTWDNYDLRENLVPYHYKSGVQQIAYYPFCYDNYGNLLESGLSEYYNNWSEIDPTGNVGTYRVTTPIPEDSYDLDVLIKLPDTQIHGLQNYFNISHGTLFNFTINLIGQVIINSGTAYYFDVHSYDQTLLARLQIIYEGVTLKLKYYDGSSYQLLTNLDDGYGDRYEFNLFLKDLCVLRYHNINETTIDQTFFFPKLDTTKEGLRFIKLWGQMPDASPDCYLYVDDIGYFANGTSLVNTFYSQQYRLYNQSSDRMYRYRHNLVEYKVNGNASLLFTNDNPYYIFSIANLTLFDNSTSLFNMWNLTFPYGSATNSYLKEPIMSIISNNLSVPEFNYFKIHGVKMIENTSTYYPLYKSSHLNIHESYFYVTDHILRYKCNFDEDSKLEYLDIYFDIPNLPTINRSASFRTYHDSYGLGYFRLNYTDETSNIYDFRDFLSSDNYILESGKIIDTLIIECSDNDNDGLTGYMGSGRIDNLVFLYLQNYVFEIGVSNILDGLIPMIIFLLPSLFLYIPFRENEEFGIVIFLGMMFVMSLVLFFSEIIPAWLLGIILLCLVMFLVIDRRDM